MMEEFGKIGRLLVRSCSHVDNVKKFEFYHNNERSLG